MLLLEIPLGQKIVVRENGSEMEYIVLTHSYNGRTLLWRAEALKEAIPFDNDPEKQEYGGSVLDTTLEQFIAVYDKELQIHIESVPIVCRNKTIYRKLFALSASELGYTDSYISIEGEALPYFSDSTYRIAHANGDSVIHWTRSAYPSESGQRARVTNSVGILGNTLVTNSRWVVPAFTLPTSTHIKRINGSYYPYFLITDRTHADYELFEHLRNKGYANMTAEEKMYWDSGTMKGAYNKGDLNRVGEYLNYLHNRLKDAGYITHKTTFTAKTNWTITSIPTAADLTYYLFCVSSIRGALSVWKSTPPAPADTGALSIEEANNIEKIMIDVETLINNMLAARLYCGDIYAGEI